jgi:NTE family protein
MTADGSVAVVAAGAGARGAFEAGALSVLVPWLAGQGRRPTIYVGTSAGSINATLLAATAHLDPDVAAAHLLDAWRGITLQKVYRSPLLGLPATAVAYAGQFLGIPGSHVVSLLDTTPLHAFFRDLFAPYAASLQENVATGIVDAVATVSTTTASRTIVFTALAPGRTLPPPNVGRAIDYTTATITSEHVLASCAIPALFAPVEIDGAYYTDGGVRLNVPLAPAIALGATRLAVVATHPDTYPPQPPPGGGGHEPDVVDAVVSLLGTVLADRMVEDLHVLEQINHIIPPNTSRLRGARRIPHVFVGPSTREEIGALAARVYAERFRGRRIADELDFRVIHQLIGPREPGDGDLLSYLFFDAVFIERAIALGRAYAEQTIAGSTPWR